MKLSALEKARNTIERRRKKLAEVEVAGDTAKITRAKLRLKDAQTASERAEYDFFADKIFREADMPVSRTTSQRSLQRTLIRRESMKSHATQEALIGEVVEVIGNGVTVETVIDGKSYEIGKVSPVSESSIRDRMKEI